MNLKILAYDFKVCNMVTDDISKNIEKLRQDIRLHDYKYYVENKPEISDQQYDSILSKLKDIEKEYPQFFSKDSPTQKIGEQALSGFKKYNISHQCLAWIIPIQRMNSESLTSALKRIFRKRA